MIKVYIHQPDFIPPLNFFLRVKKSNVFVILDDVQINRSGWTNRDLIKTKDGTKKITVPIEYIKRENAYIKDIKLHNKNEWKKKLLNQVYENYKDSKFFKENIKILELGFDKKFEKLIDLNLYFIQKYLKILDIRTKIIYSSELNIKTFKSDKMLDICCHLGATEYITGVASMIYLNKEKFQKKNIQINCDIEVKKKYNQIGEKFIPNLSIIDYMFNCCNGKTSNFLND